MSEEIPLNTLLGLIRKESNPEVLQCAQRRQVAIWEEREPDYLPLLVHGAVPERDDYPTYNLKEQFSNPEKMLYEQLWTALGVLRSRADGVPSVRVNLGTGFLASVFGLEQEVFPDKMPWLREHLSKEEILRLMPQNLEPLFEKGLLPQCRRYIELYKEKLNRTPVSIFLPDTQGPFDLAHLLVGDIIFTELYDDTDFINHLLMLSSYVYRKVTVLLKAWIGEPLNSGYHSYYLRMSGCGVRCCEDTTTLLSPKLIHSILPFTQEAIAPFGGWVHFCGNGHHMLESILSLPEVKGINFGNPEMYDWETVFPEIIAMGKLYYGTVSRKEREPLSEYFQRVLSPLKRKGNLILCLYLQEGETAQEALSLWHKVQDMHFP